MASTHCGYSCSFCSSTFTRAEHLYRHVSSHSLKRPFTCNICDQSFKRKDVLKRHWRTCNKRSGTCAERVEPASDKRGRRRTSCDQCIRRKKACNSQYPCLACASKGQQCSYFTINTFSIKGAGDELAASSAPLTNFDNQELANDLPDRHNPILRRGPAFEDIENSQVDGNSGDQMMTTNSLMPDQDALLLLNMTFDNLGSDLDWQQIFLCSPHVQTNQVRQDQIPNTVSSLRYSILENRHRLSFLITFAQRTGLTTCFECGSVNFRRQILEREVPHDNELSTSKQLMHLQDQLSRHDASLFSYDAMNQTRRPGAFLFSELESGLPHNDQQQQASFHVTKPTGSMHNAQMSHWSSWLTDPLAVVTHEIVQVIKETICNKARTSVIETRWSPLLEAMCFEMFRPPQIRRFLALFWTSWYQNGPILHRPSFEIHQASIGLLVVMILIGASISSEEADCLNARVWYDIAEEIVFENKLLYDSSDPSPHFSDKATPLTRERLSAVQAAYYVCNLQHWEARQSSGRRIQRRRHSILALAVTDLASTVENMPPMALNDFENFNWAEFGLREEAIRTITYTFLLDTSYVIFSDCKPWVLIHELRIEFARSQESFCALTAEECFAILLGEAQTQPAFRPLRILDTVETICQENISSDFLDQLRKMSVLNLFTILVGLNSLFYRLLPYKAFGPHLAPIRRGLMNWNQSWSMYDLSASSASHNDDNDSRSENMWKQNGFMCHAPELWLLTMLVLERIESTSDDGKFTALEGLAMKVLEEHSTL